MSPKCHPNVTPSRSKRHLMGTMEMSPHSATFSSSKWHPNVTQRAPHQCPLALSPPAPPNVTRRPPQRESPVPPRPVAQNVTRMPLECHPEGSASVPPPCHPQPLPDVTTKPHKGTTMGSPGSATARGPECHSGVTQVSPRGHHKERLCHSRLLRVTPDRHPKGALSPLDATQMSPDCHPVGIQRAPGAVPGSATSGCHTDATGWVPQWGPWLCHPKPLQMSPCGHHTGVTPPRHPQDPQMSPKCHPTDTARVSPGSATLSPPMPPRGHLTSVTSPPPPPAPQTSPKRHSNVTTNVTSPPPPPAIPNATRVTRWAPHWCSPICHPLNVT